MRSWLSSWRRALRSSGDAPRYMIKYTHVMANEDREKDRQALRAMLDEGRASDQVAQKSAEELRRRVRQQPAEMETPSTSTTSAPAWEGIVTVVPGLRGGRPVIRSMRITVGDVLGWLSSGMNEAEILAEYPELKETDISAAVAFAAERAELEAEAHRLRAAIERISRRFTCRLPASERLTRDDANSRSRPGDGDDADQDK